MTRPLRAILLDGLAWLLSVALSPFVCVPYFCWVFAQATTSSPQEAYRWAALCIALSIGVPALYIAWAVYQGRITDLHVRLREQREGPFRAGKWGMASLVLMLWLGQAPARLTHLAGVIWMQVFPFQHISRRWKISLHTGVLASCLAGCIELAHWSPWWLSLLLPLSWARQRRGRHGWNQAFCGAALGYGLTTYPLRWLSSL